MLFNWTQILQNYEMAYPAVTICNTNPVKRSALHKYPEVHEAIVELEAQMMLKECKEKGRDVCQNLYGKCFDELQMMTTLSFFYECRIFDRHMLSNEHFILNGIQNVH